MARALYLDSSAIVKTIVREPDSAALRRALRRSKAHASSELARAEVLRAVRRSDPGALAQARDALSRMILLGLTEELLEEAGLLDPPGLRTLDAIHLAAARSLGSDLVAFITYDDRLGATARNLGMPVESPRS